MKKFGIIIISYDNPLFKELDSLRSKVFAKFSIPVFTVYNGPGPAYLTKDSMYVTNNDMNPTMYNKLLLGCKHLLNTDWSDVDYIVRVNSSTFLNPDVLKQSIQTLPKTNCYAGSDLFNIMISGMFIIFSKDLLLRIIENGFATPDNALCFANDLFTGNRGIYENDDVIIGMLMNKWKINRVVLPTPPFFEHIHTIDEAKTINYEYLLKKNIAVRIKNMSNRNEIDLYMWKQLTELTLRQ